MPINENSVYTVRFNMAVHPSAEPCSQENIGRNFAGIGSPLNEAIAARFDAVTVAELEADAMARFAERERRNAKWKAAKGGA